MTTSRDRIITVAIDQIGELGWAKASTRSIAQRANVNELTIFRVFGSKKNLLAAALEATVGSFIETLEALRPSQNMAQDLSVLASSYSQFVQRYPRFIARVLPEVSNPDVGTLVVPLQTALITKLRMIFNYHSQAFPKELTMDALILGFLGPLLASAFLSHVIHDETWDATHYVDRFLRGYAKDVEQDPLDS